ncbi:NAD(P)/FAD-dependent oxidoreductase [Bacillus pseudomycoides]|uniref:NAD(P)/FAD-dependent oxidoreductase n=1 Tax=Bacillus pseudomycoides TaxID=64104 RepID=UPI0034C5CDA9
MIIKHSADVVIIGGGIIGAAIQYYLTKQNITNTILLEKNSFSSGSTGQSGGFIRVYHNDPYLTEIAKEGINDFFSISEEVKFKQTGMLYVENETQHIKMEKQIGELKKSGHKISILSSEVLKKEFEFINLPKNSCVAYEEQAGYISPSLATNTWIETSKTKGALACEGIEVKEILMDNNCVVGVKTSYGTIYCKHIVVAAGAWSGNILDTIGIKIPVRSKIIQIHFFDGIGQKDHPIFIDDSTGLYGRPDNLGTSLVGYPVDKYDIDPDKKMSIDPNDLEKMLQNSKSRLPYLNKNLFIGGRRSFDAYTSDNRGIIEQFPQAEGLIVATGWSGGGVKLAPGIGKRIAKMITGV